MYRYKNSDFERIYIRYKAEGFPRGESMESYCSRHNIPYNLFDKWFRDTRHKIVPVEVKGEPTEAASEAAVPSAAPQSVTSGPIAERAAQPDSRAEASPVRLLVDIRATNGLRISQRNLSYDSLKRLVEKLEGLC